jgi:hypothetical protein
MTGPHTVTIEVTPKERRQVVEALETAADRKDEQDQPGVADQLRGLARRIDR